MSDRMLLIDMATGSGLDWVQLYMDGESGTWRLFANSDGEVGTNVDFTLSALRAFRDEISRCLEDIEREPDDFNAEVRAAWEDSE